MLGKDPMDWSIEAWLFAFGIGAFGGAVEFFGKHKKKLRSASWAVFCVDFFTSGFVGLLAFMALNSFDVKAGISVALSSVCGHMATRFLFLLERAIEQKMVDLLK